jgi:hypothetical protein
MTLYNDMRVSCRRVGYNMRFQYDIRSRIIIFVAQSYLVFEGIQLRAYTIPQKSFYVRLGKRAETLVYRANTRVPLKPQPQ